MLNEVLTAGEAALLYDQQEDTIRKACQRGAANGEAWCRRSAGTWLLLRSEASRRWKAKYEPCPECHGRGHFEDRTGDTYDCFRCRGAGKVETDD